MGFKKLLNLVLKLYYYKFTFTIKMYIHMFYLFSDFLPATQAKTRITSTLANLVVNFDRNCSIKWSGAANMS